MDKWGVSGRICLYVVCYDFVLGFNVSSSPLMIFQVGFWGVILLLKCLFQTRGRIV